MVESVHNRLRETVQWLRLCAALIEDHSVVSSTHVRLLTIL